MKTNQIPAKGANKSARPITVTITGKAAENIRRAASQIGFRPSTWARMCAISGNLISDNTDEGRAFRQGMAAHEIGDRLFSFMRSQLSIRRDDDTEELLPIMFPAHAAMLLHELCQAGGIHTVDYVRECFCGEIFDSLIPEKLWEGVPDFIENAWDITEQDRRDMQSVVDRWNSKSLAKA